MKITNLIFTTVLLISFLLPINSCFAQSDSLEIHQINGKSYYVHIVDKGESLYFIHQKYNTPLEIIKAENPSVEDGLSVGEKIFIPVKKDLSTTSTIDGNYINHEVQKLQTLYSIANLYQVKQQEIIAANPEITDGLKEGQIIKIPISSLKNTNTEVAQPVKTEYKTHLIKQGETVYSLSKIYHTTVDSILLSNGGLPQGLKIGQSINIPIKIKVSESVVDHQKLPISINNIQPSGIVTNVAKKAEYTIGLLLPFYIDENAEMTQQRNVLEEKTIYPKSKFAIEFYKGFLLALDSISTDESKFKVYVYDTKGDDSTRIYNILLKPEFKKLDLIIGPLFYDNFNDVADFALQNHIPLVSPVKQSNKTLLGNEYVFKVVPSKSTSIKQICTLIVDSFKTENLLAIEYEKAKEKALVELYVKTYNNLLLIAKDTTLYSSIKTLKINYNIADVVSNLKRDKNNVIFVPATEQTFITNLFNFLSTTLNKREYQDYRVTLIGLEEWMKFENIDLDYFQQLNVHYCTERFVDYNDSITALFIKNYIKKTETYPSQNTFFGFDLAYFFGSNFINYGTLFSEASLGYYKGMSIQLNFMKTGVESGYENINSNMVRFNNYTLEKINH